MRGLENATFLPSLSAVAASCPSALENASSHRISASHPTDYHKIHYGYFYPFAHFYNGTLLISFFGDAHIPYSSFALSINEICTQ